MMRLFRPFVWLVQRHGKPEVVRPEYDQKLKGKGP